MTAEEVYVDPSALARLYIHQAGSREMSAWRAKLRGALPKAYGGVTANWFGSNQRSMVRAPARFALLPFQSGR